MNRKAPIFLALLLTAPLPAIAANPQANVTDIRVTPLQPGMNVLPKFVPDGRDAQVLEAWRDNGNAHGGTNFVIVIPQSARYEKPWGIIGVEEGDKAFQDSVYDAPHTGEDYVRSVRFARGLVDGKLSSLLITAERIQGTQPIPDPAPVKFSIYQLVASDNGVGTTPWYFTLVRQTTSAALYCNSELALNRELGLPLPTDYSGPNRKDGCF